MAPSDDDDEEDEDDEEEEEDEPLDGWGALKAATLDRNCSGFPCSVTHFSLKVVNALCSSLLSPSLWVTYI